MDLSKLERKLIETDNIKRIINILEINDLSNLSPEELKRIVNILDNKLVLKEYKPFKSFIKYLTFGGLGMFIITYIFIYIISAVTGLLNGLSALEALKNALSIILTGKEMLIMASGLTGALTVGSFTVNRKNINRKNSVEPSLDNLAHLYDLKQELKYQADFSNELDYFNFLDEEPQVSPERNSIKVLISKKIEEIRIANENKVPLKEKAKNYFNQRMTAIKTLISKKQEENKAKIAERKAQKAELKEVAKKNKAQRIVGRRPLKKKQKYNNDLVEQVTNEFNRILAIEDANISRGEFVNSANNLLSNIQNEEPAIIKGILTLVGDYCVLMFTKPNMLIKGLIYSLNSYYFYFITAALEKALDSIVDDGEMIMKVCKLTNEKDKYSEPAYMNRLLELYMEYNNPDKKQARIRTQQ